MDINLKAIDFIKFIYEEFVSKFVELSFLRFKLPLVLRLLLRFFREIELFRSCGNKSLSFTANTLAAMHYLLKQVT